MTKFLNNLWNFHFSYLCVSICSDLWFIKTEERNNVHFAHHTYWTLYRTAYVTIRKKLSTMLLTTIFKRGITGCIAGWAHLTSKSVCHKHDTKENSKDCEWILHICSLLSRTGGSSTSKCCPWKSSKNKFKQLTIF